MNKLTKENIEAIRKAKDEMIKEGKIVTKETIEAYMLNKAFRGVIPDDNGIWLTFKTA